MEARDTTLLCAEMADELFITPRVGTVSEAHCAIGRRAGVADDHGGC